MNSPKWHGVALSMIGPFLVLGGSAVNQAHAQDTLPLRVDPPYPSISSALRRWGILNSLFWRAASISNYPIFRTFGNVTGGVEDANVYIARPLYVDRRRSRKTRGTVGHDVPGQRLSAARRGPVGQQRLQLFDDQQHRGAALRRDWWSSLEQKLFSDLASIRIGQLIADTEFFTSEFGALYVNGTFVLRGDSDSSKPSGQRSRQPAGDARRPPEGDP